MKTEKIRVTKKFTFSMAHALYGHDGPCRNIHGHTYHLHVTVLGIPLEESGDAKNGMVMDFGIMKEIVKREVIAHFDHALVLNGNSEHKDLKDLHQQFNKVILLPVQPTCENLLLEFKCRIHKFFDSHHQLLSMKLEETPTSSAEWHLCDN